MQSLPRSKTTDIESRLAPYIERGEFKWNSPWLDASREELREASQLAIMQPTPSVVDNLLDATAKHAERIASLAVDTKRFKNRDIGLDIIGQHIGHEFEQTRTMVIEVLAEEIRGKIDETVGEEQAKPVGSLPQVDPDYWLNEFWVEYEIERDDIAENFNQNKMKTHLDAFLIETIFCNLPYENRVFDNPQMADA